MEIDKKERLTAEHLIIEYCLECGYNQQFLEYADIYNCKVVHAASCDSVLDIVSGLSFTPVIVIELQVANPEIYRLTSILRQNYFINVIFICQQLSSEEKIRLMTLGAMYIIERPYNYTELFRIVMILDELNNRFIQTDGKLQLDFKKWSIGYDGNWTDVTPKIFKTMVYLLDNKGTVVSREEISNYVCGYALESNKRIVDTYIKKIRAYTNYNLIKTVRNKGYIYTGSNRK